MKQIHVVAGALCNARGEVLLARRHDDSHQGGLWEFPGGKVEPGESTSQALARELDEELGVKVISARPLIRAVHHYPDLSVDLDLWKVNQWQEQATGREGQALSWVSISQLRGMAMPEADRPLISALQLPDQYAITPPRITPERLVDRLPWLHRRGVSMLQLRLEQVNRTALEQLGQELLSRCHALGIRMLVNQDVDLALRIGAAGVHLKASQLAGGPYGPFPEGFLIGASCHRPEELRQAAEIGADFALLSPVNPTASHPDAQVLGGSGFSAWVKAANLPVFALGGMSSEDRSEVFKWGGQGVAGISSFFSDCN